MYQVIIVILSLATQQVQVGVDPNTQFGSYEECAVAAVEKTVMKEPEGGIVVAFSCVKTAEKS